MRDDELVYLYLGESEGADEIAEMLFESINDLIDELISRPRRTEELRKLMPKSVLDSINRRRETS